MTRKHRLDPATALFRAGSDGYPVVDWDDHYRKWCSSVVAHLRKRTPQFVAANHRIFVIGAEHHHVGMPMTNSRSKTLICRPHVRKTDGVPPRKASLDVGGLNTLGNLIRSLPFQREFGSQLVIGHHHASRWCAETDWGADGWVIDDLAELRGRV